MCAYVYVHRVIHCIIIIIERAEREDGEIATAVRVYTHTHTVYTVYTLRSKPTVSMVVDYVDARTVNVTVALLV